MSEPHTALETRMQRRSRARRTVLVGLAVFLAFALLTFSPFLLGRGSLNKFIVAFSLVGVLLGGSFMLHGAWDWLRARGPG